MYQVLERLTLNNNCIDNLSLTLNELKPLPCLKILDLFNNPCCSSDDSAGFHSTKCNVSANYRQNVVKLLPSLLKLDRVAVTSLERDCARKSDLNDDTVDLLANTVTCEIQPESEIDTREPLETTLQATSTALGTVPTTLATMSTHDVSAPLESRKRRSNPLRRPYLESETMRRLKKLIRRHKQKQTIAKVVTDSTDSSLPIPSALRQQHYLNSASNSNQLDVWQQAELTNILNLLELKMPPFNNPVISSSPDLSIAKIEECRLSRDDVRNMFTQLILRCGVVPDKGIPTTIDFLFDLKHGLVLTSLLDSTVLPSEGILSQHLRQVLGCPLINGLIVDMTNAAKAKSQKMDTAAKSKKKKVPEATTKVTDKSKIKDKVPNLKESSQTTITAATKGRAKVSKSAANEAALAIAAEEAAKEQHLRNIRKNINTRLKRLSDFFQCHWRICTPSEATQAKAESDVEVRVKEGLEKLLQRSGTPSEADQMSLLSATFQGASNIRQLEAKIDCNRGNTPTNKVPWRADYLVLPSLQEKNKLVNRIVTLEA